MKIVDVECKITEVAPRAGARIETWTSQCDRRHR